MEEIEQASSKLLSFLSNQRKLLPTKCEDKIAPKKEMEDNIQSLCNILRAHISKYTFIVAECGGRGSLDTSGQLVEGTELLVTSIRILRNEAGIDFGRKLTEIGDGFLKQTEQLVRTLRKGGNSGAETGMVWKHLDDLKAMKISPHKDTLKSFEDMQSRMKDILEELKELKENCIMVESLSEEEEEVQAKDDFEDDFDALFDDGPERLTKAGLARVEIFISSINFFRKTFLDIYVWLKKGLKYKSERHDEWLTSLMSRRKKFLRNLDMWGAALHEPQEPVEVEQESINCLNFFEEYINAAQTLQSFSRRKFVTRKRGKKVAGTGKEWYANILADINNIRKQVHSYQAITGI